MNRARQDAITTEIMEIVGGAEALRSGVGVADEEFDTAMSLGDPKVFISVVTWAVYSFALLSRRMMGWTGRRAALLSASGFGIVLLNFLAVSYLLKTSHSF